MNRVDAASRRALVALLVLFLGMPGTAAADVRACVSAVTVTATATAETVCEADGCEMPVGTSGCEMPGGTSDCAAQACSAASCALPQFTLTPVVPSEPALRQHSADNPVALNPSAPDPRPPRA